MLEGSPQYCYETTRLRQGVLRQFIEELVTHGELQGKKVSAAEQIIMFLHLCGHRTTYRQIGLIYGHSTRTVHVAVVRVSKLLCSLYDRFVHAPEPGVPAFIANNPKMVAFSGAVGALDGTYVPVRLKGVNASK